MAIEVRSNPRVSDATMLAIPAFDTLERISCFEMASLVNSGVLRVGLKR
jgi:hypothetical protein